MYEPGTLLKLKEPRSTEAEPFPYDRVEVVGQSPIMHSGGAAMWSGAESQGVIIKPLEGFASTVDEPYGKLRDMYDVEFIPDNYIDVEPRIRVIKSTSGSAGATPEEQFKEAAERRGDPKSETRGKTPMSPLDVKPEVKVEVSKKK